ncbi:MAG: SIS domain-containing protein [Gemmatimonadota bacterium]|nr:SIS domain-containing protein [Gemmatimonadota bacterium]
MPTPSTSDLVSAHLLGSADVMRRTAESAAEDLGRAAVLVADAFRAGGKLLLCGNGGSAADCSHLAAEFVNLLDRKRDRPGLAAISLTADGAVLSATANDRGYAEIFARQVEALGRPGDVLLALSTSGSSPNIVQALATARARDLVTILLTGDTDGAALAHAQLSIRVPSADTQHVQEAHLALGHALVAIVEGALFPASHAGP